MYAHEKAPVPVVGTPFSFKGRYERERWSDPNLALNLRFEPGKDYPKPYILLDRNDPNMRVFFDAFYTPRTEGSFVNMMRTVVNEERLKRLWIAGRLSQQEADLMSCNIVATAEQRAYVWAAGCGSCAYCNIPVVPGARKLTRQAYEVDHKIPFSIGGRTYVENLTAACAPCNRAKYHATDEEFRDQLAQEGLEWRDTMFTELTGIQLVTPARS